MPQWRWKILRAATKTWFKQIYIKKKKKSQDNTNSWTQSPAYSREQPVNVNELSSSVFSAQRMKGRRRTEVWEETQGTRAVLVLVVFLSCRFAHLSSLRSKLVTVSLHLETLSQGSPTEFRVESPLAFRRTSIHSIFSWCLPPPTVARLSSPPPAWGLSCFQDLSLYN